MRYALLLKPHANVRYRQSLQKLALIELASMLCAWGIEDAQPHIENLAGDSYLTFDTENMTKRAWQDISRHSAVCFAAQCHEGGLLKPLERNTRSSLPDDLPHVLKYKGKTNADFTFLLLHCAKAASNFAQADEPLTVLDPMCGKATTLFCAVCEGHHAIGIETDGKALTEAAGYYERSLKLHRLKHKRSESSRTMRKGGCVRCFSFEATPGAQEVKDARTIRMDLLHGDATRLPEMIKPDSCHIAVCDLPYGIQHAPKENGGLSSLDKLLNRVAVACEHVLKPGGAVAFSFNLHTLPRKNAEQALEAAGFQVLRQTPYHDFSHWVEQAVDRDVVVARKPKTV